MSTSWVALILCVNSQPQPLEGNALGFLSVEGRPECTTEPERGGAAHNFNESSAVRGSAGPATAAPGHGVREHRKEANVCDGGSLNTSKGPSPGPSPDLAALGSIVNRTPTPAPDGDEGGV